MSGLRFIAGALAATLLALPGCGTMEPFSRGELLEEEKPDAGPVVRTDAGSGSTDGGETTPDGGDGPPAPAFRADVHPLLLDCTACHADGAGNFKITGSDADADYATVSTKVSLDSPEASLLLTKPTKQVDHQGGKLWDPEGASAATVLGWIRAGAKDD